MLKCYIYSILDKIYQSIAENLKNSENVLKKCAYLVIFILLIMLINNIVENNENFLAYCTLLVYNLEFTTPCMSVASSSLHVF